MAEEAHRLGLAVGLKNALEQIPDLLDVYDFFVNGARLNVCGSAFLCIESVELNS